MQTEEITRKCDSCKEPVSIDASKCPHCRSRQLTTRGKIAVVTLLGIICLPLTYVGLQVAWAQGVPSGFAEGIGLGIVLAIALIGPLFILLGIGGYAQRREAIREANPQS